MLNISLRRKPQDASVKTTAARIKLPSNVPNLKVPTTNEDVVRAMNADGKLLDGHLSRTNTLLSKALVPIVYMLNDVGTKNTKPLEKYMEGLNDSLRLIAASFNFLNQTRKELARIYVRETALGQLCKWDHEVGQDKLFPFDVSKRCDELNKVKKLGAQAHKRPRTQFDSKWPKPRFNYRSPGPNYYRPGNTTPNWSNFSKAKKKPFLGKKQQTISLT